MRKTTRLSLALVTSAAMVGLAALPASAVDGDESVPPVLTQATIEVKGGLLGISVAPALAPVTDLIPGSEAVFSVPDVAVTDHRAVEGSWNVSVALTDFTTDVKAAKNIPAAGSSYTIVEDSLAKAGTTGELVSTKAEWTLASQELPAVSAPGVHGNNTADWDATLTVPVPSDALAGNYQATLTHSVL